MFIFSLFHLLFGYESYKIIEFVYQCLKMILTKTWILKQISETLVVNKNLDTTSTQLLPIVDFTDKQSI